MKLQNVNGEVLSLTASQEEITFLNNSVLEALEALEDWEFPIRTGQSVEFAKSMMKELQGFLESSK